MSGSLEGQSKVQSPGPLLVSARVRANTAGPLLALSFLLNSPLSELPAFSLYLGPNTNLALR